MKNETYNHSFFYAQNSDYVYDLDDNPAAHATVAFGTTADGRIVDYAYAWPEETLDNHVTGRWLVQTGHFDMHDERSEYYLDVRDAKEIIANYEGGAPDPYDFEEREPARFANYIAAFRHDEEGEVPITALDYHDALDHIESFVRDCGGSVIPKFLKGKLLADMLDEENYLRYNYALDRDPETVKDWYRATYPLDALGESINPDLDFAGALGAVVDADGIDFYDAIGVGDSVARNRIFKEIAGRYHLDYKDINDAWLGVGTWGAARIEHVYNATKSKQAATRPVETLSQSSPIVKLYADLERTMGAAITDFNKGLDAIIDEHGEDAATATEGDEGYSLDSTIREIQEYQHVINNGDDGPAGTDAIDADRGDNKER